MSSNADDKDFLSNINTVLPDAETTIGTITLLWSNLHFIMFRIFVVSTDMDEKTAKATYFSIKTDRAQRDMTLAAAEAYLEGSEHAGIAASIINEVNKLSGERNAFIHTIWAFVPKDMTHIPMPTLPRHKKLSEDPEKQAEDLIVKLIDLRSRLAGVAWKIEVHRTLQKTSQTPSR